MQKKSSIFKKLILLSGIILALIIVGAYPAFLLAKHYVNSYFEKWGTRLVNLEKRGGLSQEFGAGWQDVRTNDSMDSEAARITKVQYSASSSNDSNLQEPYKCKKNPPF